MTTTKSASNLAMEIEQVVSRYLVEVRQAVGHGVERALGAFASRASTPTRAVSSKRARSSSRRTSSEINVLSERLQELVRARPGGAMAEFAAEFEMPVRALHRPMSMLLRDGRVRSVGQRRQTRYFPMVAGKK